MNMKSKLAVLLACTGLISSVGAYAGEWGTIGTVAASFSVTSGTNYTVTWDPNGKSISSGEAMSNGVGTITIINNEGAKGPQLGSSENISFSDPNGKSGVLTFIGDNGENIEMTATAQNFTGVGPKINGGQAASTSAGEITTNSAMFNIMPVGKGTLPAGRYNDVITVKLWR